MATTHPTATRNLLAEAIRTAANTGADTCLIIGTSGLALPSTGVLAIIPLDAFAAASGGTTNSPSNGNNVVAVGSGTAALAIVANDSSSPASSAEVFRGVVGSGSGEVNISSTSIAAGDTVTLTSDVPWTAPA